MDNPQSTIRNPQSQPQVLRVREGCRCKIGEAPVRLFSVTLSRPAGQDLGIVAAAQDPNPIDSGQLTVDSEDESGIAHCPLSTVNCPPGIPAAGSPHFDQPGWIACPPEIHPVGLRHAGGAMIARESCFYNVVVRYRNQGERQKAECRSEEGNGGAVSDFRLPPSAFRLPPEGRAC